MPNKYRVLVADDEPMLRRVLTKVLTRAGYDVVDVEDGEKALQHATQHHFDLHVFDQNMPIHTGKELLSMLRAHNPDIRIVISSGENLTFSADEEQPTGFLEKPFVLKGLREKIAHFLEG